MNREELIKVIVGQTVIMPCPFCGEQASLQQEHDQDMQAWIPYSVVICENAKCQARGPRFSSRDYSEFDRKLNALSTWNTRWK